MELPTQTEPREWTPLSPDKIEALINKITDWEKDVEYNEMTWALAKKTINEHRSPDRWVE